MKQLNEYERILTVFGLVLTVLAVGSSVATEVGARRYLAEYQRRAAQGPGVIQQGAAVSATKLKYVGFEQQTLASRWSFPDGHGTLGAGFALFGVILVVAPLANAKKRAATG